MIGDGNDSFADADPLIDGGGFYYPDPNELDPPDTDVDYFVFQSDGPAATWILDTCDVDIDG